MQWRIHSGVVGVARPLGNHGNNLKAPICDLLELGSSGSDSHANCSTKSLNEDSAGRGRYHFGIFLFGIVLDLENGNYQLIPLRLRRFSIAAAPRMVALPEWLQGAANTLRVLCIWDCENLDALPEWLTSFTSLRILHLSECPKLVSLPEGMHPLEVKIEHCPQLKRGI
ncbi:uncharacterized protein LOC126609076 [Malus sylvestris]|uniref:uncharacterized protein LOC126609076 n=1 Tax=Malus sylvestris TaxID=3752 RepID=UPI0021ABBEFB|nr:uncharacterized protein LOC126609076 [Malus sylvestris]